MRRRIRYDFRELGARDAPLLQAMAQHLRRKRLAFHTPGHKGGALADPAFLKLVGRKALTADLTELPGLDSLLSPEGVLAKSQQLAAQVFGWDWCFFSLNGATAAVAAALLYAVSGAHLDERAGVLLPTDAHLSAFFGLVLSGAFPVYAATRFDAEFGVPLGPSIEDLASAFGGAGSAGARPAAALLVNPNYYGASADLNGAVRLLHGYDTMVVVDEAHGSLLPFGEGRLPPPASRCGAEISVVSLHKTGGSMTQTALLLVRGGEAEGLRAARCLRLLHSTSPSYVLMASVESACRTLRRLAPKGVGRLVEMAEEAAQRIEAAGLRCLSRHRGGPSPAVRDRKGDWARPAFDPTRIVVNTLDLGITGMEAAAALEDEGVECEFGDPGNVVFVLSLADDARTIRELTRGLEALARARGSAGRSSPACAAAARSFQAAYRHVLCEVGERRFEMAPREAFLAPARDVDLGDSVGAVAAEPLFVFPPGFVLAAPGERISEAVVELAARAADVGVSVHALGDPSGTRVSVVTARARA